jgi:signal peptidase I
MTEDRPRRTRGVDEEASQAVRETEPAESSGRTRSALPWKHYEADTAQLRDGGNGSAPPPEVQPLTRRERRRARKEAAAKGSMLRELPVLVLVALVLALLIKSFLVQAFFIPSGSMEDTLQVGDRVLVSKVVYHLRDIERGDVVVFNGLDSWTPEVEISEPTNPVQRALRGIAGAFGVAPPGERDFIKRVIGVGGDTVECRASRVYVNTIPLDEPYLFPGDKPCADGENFKVQVPSGRLWVMGDHRSASADSRAHQDDPNQGTVPVDRVIGRAFVVVWPLPHWKSLAIPETFEQPALTAAEGLTATFPSALGVAAALPLVVVGRPRRYRRPWRAGRG